MTPEPGFTRKYWPEGAEEFFDSLPAGFVCTSPGGLILRANRLFLKWIGYDRNEVEDKLRLVDLLTAGGRIFYETHVSLFLKVNRELNPVALELVGKERVVMPVLMSAKQQQDDTGAARLNCITFFAARERRGYERELLSARKRAERDAVELSAANRSLAVSNAVVVAHAAELARANADLLHFAYAVSHDLQTPVRTVTIFSQLLASTCKPLLDEKGEAIISQIVNASTRMGTMIVDLLQFARVAGTEPLPGARCSLESALASALETLGGGIAEAQAVVTHDPLPTVFGETWQLAQIFQNLVGNSLKYRKPDTPPRIHISCHRKGPVWVITVHDNGIGFNPEFSERIFGVFQRLHSTEFAGTGIGLTICKRIAERHGGQIWAEGTPGEGAAFSFSIPVEGNMTSAQTQSLPSPPIHRESVDPLSRDLAGHSLFDELFHALDLAQAVVRDLDGKILIWTKGAGHLFGWARGEAVGHRIQDLLHKEFPKPRAEIQADLLRNGEWAGQVKAKTKDGTTIWLASHMSLHRDGSGRPQSVVEVHNSIDALKETEAALRRSSEQRDLAMRAGRMGIWQLDIRTGAGEWDKTLENLCGPFEMRWDRVHPDDRAVVEARVALKLNQSQDFIDECRMRRNDGEYIWLRSQGQRTINGDGTPTSGWIGLAWDNTARREQELALQAMSRKPEPPAGIEPADCGS